MLWNLATLGVFELGQALPATAGMFSSRLGLISQFSLGDYAVHLLGLSPDTKDVLLTGGRAATARRPDHPPPLGMRA